MARYLGIEITESMIRGAVLKTGYKKLVLEGVTTVLRGPGPEGITRAAQELVQNVGSALDGIYAALPGTDVSLRVIELPRAVYRRGDRALQAELEGTVPFNIDDALVTAQVIRPGDPVVLLAAAVLTARAETTVRALVEGGCDPRELGVAPVALGELSAVIPELSVPGPVLVVHAYERHADVAVLVDGEVAFARTLGGLTTPAARERGLRQTLAAFQSSHGTLPVAAYLCGEEAHLAATTVADACGLPASAVGPLPNGTVEPGPGAGESSVSDAPLAVALALRGLGRGVRIDFRKGPLAVASSAQVLRERAPYLLAATASVLVFWGLATYARYQGLASERARLLDTLGAVTQEVFGDRIDDPDRAIALARGDAADQDVDPMPGADVYDVLGVLSTRIREGIRHDVEQLDVNGEHVQLQGVVDTLQDRDRVVEALGQYECFPAVRPGRVTTTPGDNRQKYTLDIDLRCPEQRPRNERRSTTREGGNRREESTEGGSRGGST